MLIFSRTLLLAAFLLSGAVVALPGQSVSPQALGLNLALRSGEASKLVYINNARISEVSAFTSAAGRSHLKFTLSADGETHQAIIFAGEWKPEDQAILTKGIASLVGVWSTFANQPSLTVKKVSAAPYAPSATAAAKGNTVVRIDGAQVNVPSVQQFTSAAQKVHVTYTFSAGGKTYQGVVYAGTLTPALLDRLKAGKVTLYGSWSTFDGKPSFVTTRVEK